MRLWQKVLEFGERARRMDNRRAVERNGRKRWIERPLGSKSCFTLRLGATALLIRSCLDLSYTFAVIAVVGEVSALVFLDYFPTFFGGIGFLL